MKNPIIIQIEPWFNDRILMRFKNAGAKEIVEKYVNNLFTL